MRFVTIKPETFPQLEPLFERYFADVKYPGTLSLPTIQNFWTTMLSKEVAEVTAVYREGGEPCAVIGALFLPDFVNNELLATIMWWYVLPEFRRLGLGTQLLELVEKSARARGCAEIVHGHRFTVSPDGGRHLLEPRGYEVYELQFRKFLNR